MKHNVVYENRTKHVEVWTEDFLRPVPHMHKELEIIYVEEGESHLFIDNNFETIKKGDLFICFPNQVHCYERSETGKYNLFTIVPDYCYGIKDILCDSVPKNNVLKLEKDNIILKSLSDALNYQGEHKETFQAGIINYTLALILPQLVLSPRIKSSITTLQNIIHYCAENFTGELTLDDISNELHISKYHISHLLNKKLGISFTGYINMLRVNYACDLLRDTDNSIASISEEAGFGSIRTFNREFSRIMNISPYNYRKNHFL